jgi:hypothetical protein
MDKQRLLEQVAADARALPGRQSPSRRWRAMCRSCANRRCRCRGWPPAPSPDPYGTFQRDLSIGLDAALAERQDGFELLPIGADIGAGEAENGWGLGSVRDPGRRRRGAWRPIDDVGPGAGEIGAMLAAPLWRGRQRCRLPSQGCPPVVPPPSIPSTKFTHFPDNTNKIQ